MKVRLGYVSIALGLPKVTSSSSVTYTNYKKILSEELQYKKLKKVTLSNLVALNKILQYNLQKQIHFYRITSALIPLSTHPDVNWDYRKLLTIECKSIGDFVKAHEMRVDTHPDQFNVINSLNPQVVESTLRNLWVHVNLFEDMDYPKGKMVLHVGSGAEGKENALERFQCNFHKLPEEVNSRIILENDDKTFTARNTLKLCKSLGIPMVLDVHHDMCNNEGGSIEGLLPDIFHTWDKEDLPPKIHFSSPREGIGDRKHADYIDVHEFVRFIEKCRIIGRDFDIMIEAKKKDFALFDLVHSIKRERPEWKWLDGSTFCC